MTRKGWIWLAGAACLVGGTARAQDLQDRPVEPPPPGADEPMPPTTEDVIDFSADALEYQNRTEVVTATGDVRMTREGTRLRADRVIWNRQTGEVRAEGNVAVVNATGDTVYGDNVRLTDTLRDGAIDNLLLVLGSGGRLAASRGTRTGDVYALENAAYTGCPVAEQDGCTPREPTWKITAVRVTYDESRRRVFYSGARLHLFGASLLPLPLLSTPSGGEGGPGVLVPDARISRVNGLEIAIPYYFKLAPNRDLTLTPHIYSNVLPALMANYRALTNHGAYQVSGMITEGRRLEAALNPIESERGIRGFLDASGRFQLSPRWSVTGSLRSTTDRTFLRRYDISRDDRLRSTISAERLGVDSYFALTGWATQTLRINDPQGQQPIALPELDYRRRLTDPLLGGLLELQLNTLAVGRTDGQDTQRAFAGFRWDLRRLTTFGQEVTLTAYGRGDVYNSDENALTPTVVYRGQPGWQTRAIAALAVDVRWPLVGAIGNGAQRITPRVQLVATAPVRNLAIPNEDARAIELEDSNLFALNRFPGYDRFEDGARITYGLDYGLTVPGMSVVANIGQSFRLDNRPVLFPNGVGLSGKLSDIVGRATVRFRDFVAVTHRFRVDKDSFAVRRNEIDATIGSRQTYVLLGYLRLNRDIDTAIEDLRDREEVRVGGRVQVGRYWSVFGSAIADLTDRAEDPLSSSDGFQPIRHRIGVAYTDECLDLGLTWRRDYQAVGDARRGNAFLLRLSFKNLGR